MSKKDKEVFMWDENLAMTKLPSTPKLCKDKITDNEKIYKEEPKEEPKGEPKGEPKEESKEDKDNLGTIQKEIDEDPFFFS